MRSLCLIVALSFISGCGAQSSRQPAPSPTSPSASVTAITLSGSATLYAGTTSQWSATATFSDHTTSIVTDKVTWESTDQAVVRVAATGLVTAVARGQATIHVTYLGLSTTAAVTVNSPVYMGLVVRGNRTLVAGAPVQWSVLGSSPGGEIDVTHDATLQSSDPGIVRVSSGGLVTGVAPGEATVSATYQGLTSSGTRVVVGTIGVPVNITYTVSRELSFLAQFSVRLDSIHYSQGEVASCSTTGVAAGGTTVWTCPVTLVGPGSYVVTSPNFIGSPCGASGYAVQSAGSTVPLSRIISELISTTDMCLAPFTLDGTGKVGG